MKEWRLNFDKCMEFGSNGASTMIGKNNDVVVRLKEKVSFFFICIHCVTYKTNLATMNITKVQRNV